MSDDARDPYPGVQTIYQQLHNYPVGKGNKVDDPETPGQKAFQGDLAARRTQGNKYNIAPVRREVLMDLKAVACIDGNPEPEDRVRRGLTGEFNSTRYGVPFLGDNQYLVDRLKVLDKVPPAYWYENRLPKPADARRAAGRRA